METKEESPHIQPQGSPNEEHASPKKRRKVNHGRYDSLSFPATASRADRRLGSMYLLPEIGKYTCFLPAPVAVLLPLFAANIDGRES